MKKNLTLLLLIVLFFQNSAVAEVSMGEKIIGLTFKSLAKAYVVTLNINKFKEKYINKLERMEEEKFRTRYAKVYESIKELPPHLKATYGITEHMAKEEAIRNIESLEKKKAYEVINAIPDKLIAKLFKQHLSEKKEEIQRGKKNIVKQIKQLWSKIIEKAEKK